MGHKFSEAEIISDIEKMIVENAMEPGVKLPSAAQYAIQYGVSAKTTDRALNHLERRGLIERRRGSGNFVRANRRQNDRINAGFIWWSISGILPLDFNPGTVFWQKLCRLMSEHQINYDIFFEDYHKLKQPVNRLRKYDILIAPAGLIQHNPEAFHSCRIPLIIYGDDHLNPGPWHQVIYDYRPGFLKALEYCRENRVKKIFLPGLDREIVCNKHAVFMECAKKSGYRAQDIHIYSVPENPARSVELAGMQCAEYFLEKGLHDHLIFSVSDVFTFGLFEVFNRHKLVSGKDFRMISYDNFQRFFGEDNRYFNISSITHPQEECAAAVVELVETVSRKPDAGFYRNYIVPATEFVIR